MSGYTPVFGSVFDGTLCGQWPDVGVWLCLLALADKRGHVDMTPQRIAAVTGVPVPDLLACLQRFLAPDPNSRSPAAEGKRLELLAPSRNWGWQIVNFEAYRTKARKAAYDSQRTDSGEDAIRKRTLRGTASRRVPTSPGTTAAVPLSNLDSDSDKDLRPLPTLPVRLPDGLDRNAWGEWIAYRRSRGYSMNSQTLGKQVKVLLPHPPEIQQQMVDASIQASWRGLFPIKLGNGTRAAVQQPTFDLAAWAAKETE